MTKVHVDRDKDLFSVEIASIASLNHEPSLGQSVRYGKEMSMRLDDERKEGKVVTSQNLHHVDSGDPHSRSSRNTIFTFSNDTMDTDNHNQSNGQNLKFWQRPKHLPLNSEKLEHENVARKRAEIFRQMILSGQIKTSWMDAFLPFGIVLLGFASTTPFTLIPCHDLVVFPSYWYEIFLPGILGLNTAFAIGWLLARSFLNLRYILNAQNVLFICLVGMFPPIFLLLTTYYIWTFLGYCYPIPFLGQYTLLFQRGFSSMVIWFYLPKEWRKSSSVKKMMKCFILREIMGIIVIVVYELIVQVIKTSPDKYQPIAALALPACREVYVWISVKLVSRCSNGDNTGSMIILKFFINSHYAVNLCAVLGSIATDTTTMVLIGVDTSYNVWLCLKIIQMKRKNSNRIDEQVEVLQDMVLNELVEFLVPLAFMLALAGAYYGPNSELFGNIGNGYWAFEAIEDINQYFTNVATFFFIDLSTTVATAIVLWFPWRIAYWNAFVELQMEFFAEFCFILGYVLIMVSIKLF